MEVPPTFFGTQYTSTIVDNALGKQFATTLGGVGVVINNFFGNASPLQPLLEPAAAEQKPLSFVTGITEISTNRFAGVNNLFAGVSIGAALGVVLDKDKKKKKCL